MSAISHSYAWTMPTESNFIDRLKALGLHPAARGFNDDCAVMSGVSGDLVVTHDMIAEGVHFLPEADPADVAWRLVAVNLSDLASSGARPLGVLMGYSLSGDAEWDAAFVAGLEAALTHFDVPLIGGDTVAVSPGAQRAMGLTALGLAPAGGAPSRAGAKPGDSVWVTGTIGDAGAGLALAERGLTEPAPLLLAHNRPQPLLTQGQKLAPMVSAMMDVSDGLLVDAMRMAKASGVQLDIDLELIPISVDYISMYGDSLESRLRAATSGDDYALLFTMNEEDVPPVSSTLIGMIWSGEGIGLAFHGDEVPLPETLGYQH